MKVTEENALKILLIDDEPYELKFLAYQLKRLGYVELMLCEHAHDALSLLGARGHTIGLVFCDLQMPDMDGVEIVRHLASIGYRGDVVLVSGEDARILQNVQNVARALQIRVLGTVPKPVSPEKLQRVLANSAYHSVTADHPPQPPHVATELKSAISGGELVIHYQPQVELATGGLIGVEALVRWQGPQGVLLYPDQFIATPEEHSLTDKLTRAVLTAALRQARVWRDTGLELRMGVNISIANLAAPDFHDVVVHLAKEADVALSSLVLEVTESHLLRDLQEPLDIFSRLRLKRIGLAIDDFGSGSSPLVQLRDIPFTELKLDRRVVHGLARDSSLKAIVEGTLAMARQLGMKTVAVGLADRADWNFLRMLGCDRAQGSLIAQPMPGIDFPDWYADWDLRREVLIDASS